MKVKNFIVACFVILIILPLSAQVQQEEEKPEPLTRILFVLDASQSMYGRWQSDMKITIARKLLTNLLDSLQTVENIDLALRVYGHQYRFPPQVCNDTKLMVPFGNEDNIKRIQHKLRTLTPKGTTPIAYALEQAGSDFPACENCRNIIVLITDGLEECDGDPCAVSQALQKKGVVLKPFIIGIGKNFREAFDCVGTYFDASSEEDFSKALNVVISQALNSTTAQVNLLDEYDKPTETNVSLTFYDNFSGLIKYNFVHTINNKGFPDTLVIDPLLTYNIVVHTIPPKRADKIVLSPGKHTTIGIKCPQGTLDLKLEGRDRTVKDLKCIVRQDGKMQTLNIQQFGQTEKYITGKYDLEVLTLPRIYIDDVEISQSHITTIEIPLPGIAVIEKKAAGYGGIYLEKDNMLDFVYNFRENSLDRETIVLQPGNYRVIFRSKYSNRSMYSVEKRFTVETGKSVNVKLYR
ncbi:MAG: VWA domain-containing protein [Bacteroidales bacterium]|nr:VWA domain-containing protein [Bacteroidales bacterium]MCF8404274.1 VWA domain-containing protein [Bacteroidales bacterium]